MMKSLDYVYIMKKIIFSICIMVVLQAASLMNSSAYAKSHNTSSKSAVMKTVPDPLEPVNRAVFRFNELLDKFLLRPLAVTYRKIVPEPGRRSINNALDNLSNPVSAVNSIFQGNFTKASDYSWRFVVNSTLGVGGLFDVAKVAGLYVKDSEDLGQTFGHYNMGPGFYLVLPVLGPSTFRDAVGRVGDGFMDPFNYVDSDAYHITKNTLYGFSQRERVLDITDDVYRSSFDPYATLRSLYTQNRVRQINR